MSETVGAYVGQEILTKRPVDESHFHPLRRKKHEKSY